MIIVVVVVVLVKSECINTYTQRKLPSATVREFTMYRIGIGIGIGIAILRCPCNQDNRQSTSHHQPLAVSFCIFQVLRFDSLISQTSINRIDMTALKLPNPSSSLSPSDCPFALWEIHIGRELSHLLVACLLLLRACWIFYEISRRVFSRHLQKIKQQT